MTARRWRALEPRVREALGPVEVESTRGPRDAARIAREGVRAGVERVIVAGGDGTVNETVTGLLGADLGGYAQLGVLPLGTGGDFARSVGLPRRFDAALEVLSAGHAARVDAGRIHYVDHAGKKATAFFVNIASFGISGLTDELVNRASKRLGGTASFLIGTVKALARHQSERVVIRVDGEVVYEGPLVLATAANGLYFGGGMLVAPQARLDDGWLDVVAVPGMSKAGLLRKLPLIYSGKHLDDPAVGVFRGRLIEAHSTGGSVLLDVDGEALGALPARFELIPRALDVIGASA